MKEQIKQLLQSQLSEDGLVETGVKGVQLFRVTESIRCAPAVYEPSLVVILSGSKEAIWDGERHVYDNSQYLCCSVSLPVEAGTPDSSPDNPLLGVYISLDTKVMTELAIKMDSAVGAMRKSTEVADTQGVTLANWDNDFADALWRLLQLSQSEADTVILGDSRLREVYYAVLKGEAGNAVRSAFGAGNQIARAIDYLSCRLDKAVTIDDLSAQVGMSRAVFHRKFKQATRMSPIQFMKSMRLNTAAMKIAEGMNVSQAAMTVGYVSSSQFSREFKRMYGVSPKQWRQAPTSRVN